MTVRTRREREQAEREQAEREQLIVTAARKPAESEGWSAVTTPPLASEVEYSQPVLHSHFKGRGAIMAAVAVEGCGVLAAALRTARTSATDERGAPAALSRAYTDFARERPALYDAMFTHAVDLPFATPEAPAALHEAFDELRLAVEPMAVDGDDPVLLTETYWASLHGLATLPRSGHLPWRPTTTAWHY